MNGWWRLWIFITVFWAVVVVSVSAWIVIDDSQQSAKGPWVKYRLNDEARGFYEDLEVDEEGPAYTVVLEYEDGTEQSIRFTLIEKKISKIDFESKLNKLAQEQGKTLGPDNIDNFIERVIIKNEQAQNAKNAFDAAVKSEKARKVEQRREFIYTALAILTIPSLFLLFIGVGAAWIRRGFKKNV